LGKENLQVYLLAGILEGKTDSYGAFIY